MLNEQSNRKRVSDVAAVAAAVTAAAVVRHGSLQYRPVTMTTIAITNLPLHNQANQQPHKLQIQRNFQQILFRYQRLFDFL